jgi:hypothetical protein
MLVTVSVTTNKMFKFMFKFFSQKANHSPKKYVLFNVDTFNTWFNDSDNGATYANSGIFLRLNKLSLSHINEYLIKCHGVDPHDWSDDIEIFYEEIRTNWMTKTK